MQLVQLEYQSCVPNQNTLEHTIYVQQKLVDFCRNLYLRKLQPICILLYWHIVRIPVKYMQGTPSQFNDIGLPLLVLQPFKIVIKLCIVLELYLTVLYRWSENGWFQRFSINMSTMVRFISSKYMIIFCLISTVRYRLLKNWIIIGEQLKLTVGNIPNFVANQLYHEMWFIKKFCIFTLYQQTPQPVILYVHLEC